MDDRSELVSVLEDAGFSPYQADAYVTLLEFGAAPATEIAQASDVPDPRIYDVLRDLEPIFRTLLRCQGQFRKSR